MWITLCCVNTTAINNKKGIIVIFIAVTHSLGLKTRNHSRADHCHSLVLETQAIIMLVTVIIWCWRHRIIMLVIVTVWCWRHRQSSCWSLSQSGVGDTESLCWPLSQSGVGDIESSCWPLSQSGVGDTGNHHVGHCLNLVLETQAIIMLVTVTVWGWRHRIIMLVTVTVWSWRHRIIMLVTVTVWCWRHRESYSSLWQFTFEVTSHGIMVLLAAGSGILWSCIEKLMGCWSVVWWWCQLQV